MTRANSKQITGQDILRNFSDNKANYSYAEEHHKNVKQDLGMWVGTYDLNGLVTAAQVLKQLKQNKLQNKLLKKHMQRPDAFLEIMVNKYDFREW